MAKKRAREEAKDAPPADVDKMDEDGSDDEVSCGCWLAGKMACASLLT